MIGGLRVTGLDKALTSLNVEVKRIRFKTKKGMIAAGLFLQRQAQKKVPVDLANLKASAFTVWGPRSAIRRPRFQGEESSRMASDYEAVSNEEAMSLPAGTLNPTVEVGFTAFYALFVHEKDANHKVGEKKFLERALNENRGEILRIIQTEGKTI